MKKLILGLIVGMMIGSATTALAAPDIVQATVAKFKFVVNGQSKEVKTEQLVVMGTTYLPVREVSNMLGFDVTYKSDQRTIELNGTVSQPDSGQTADEDVKPVNEMISLDDLQEKYGVSVVFIDSSQTLNRITLTKGDKQLVFLTSKDIQNGESLMISGGYSLTFKDGVFYAHADVQKFFES